MSKLIEKYREINNRLQRLADRVGVHWFIVLLGVVILIGSTIFGLIKFGFWLWDLSHPEPPIIIIKSRIDSINKNIITDLNKQGYFLKRYFLLDNCGHMRNILHFVRHDEFDFVKTSAGFLRIGQENLTYSISLLTNKKTGNIPLYIYSHDTKFLIQKRVVSVKEAGESSNIEWIYEKRLDIDLSTHYFTKHEVLFDIVPEKDGNITIKCLGINCKIIETKFILWKTPPSTNIGGLAYYPNGTPFFSNFRVPQPNFSKVTFYEFDVLNQKLNEISTDNQTDEYVYFSFLPCTNKKKIYLKKLSNT